jgi:hypothetical protein
LHDIFDFILNKSGLSMEVEEFISVTYRTSDSQSVDVKADA